MHMVVRSFADAFDNEHIYQVGDVYPRPGFKPSDERLEELSSNLNKTGSPVIVDESREEDVSEATEDTLGNEAGVNPPKVVESKGKPRKGHRENA